MTGQTITHYEVLEKLGGGGMGVVYRGRDLHLNRFVALKFLAPELTRDDSAKARFIQEAQAASALDHTNICTIHEIAETPEGQSFIVMACYEGETLKNRIERGPLKLDDALDIALGRWSRARRRARVRHRAPRRQAGERDADPPW
jgi:serine/threonine protein kinase